MERWLLTFGFILWASAAAAAAPLCMSDGELMAEVADGFRFEHGFLAAQCDGLKKDGARADSMPSELHRRLFEKFAARFSRYRAVRESLYMRLYGEEWRFFLLKERKGKTGYLIRTLRVNEAVCRELSDKLSEMLARDWTHVRQRLERTFAAARPGIPPCH